MKAPSSTSSTSIESSQERSDGSNTSAPPRRMRPLPFILATLLAIAATVLAYMQPLRPDALHEPHAFTPAWFVYPIEHNAFARIPVITAEPRAVFALPDGQHVWAAGRGGLVVRSSDGGRTWANTVLNVARQRPAPAAAAMAPGPSHHR